METDGRPVVIIDRDGTINVEVNYLHRIEDFEWIAGAPEAIARLKAAGFVVVVVTNQAGVAYGYYEEEDVQRLHAYVQERLSEYGTRIDDFYYCPYHPEAQVEAYREKSRHRKPGTGMYEQVVRDWKADASRSFVVGDKNSDLIPGNELGMTTVLVRTGHGRDAEEGSPADHVVDDLRRAVDLILD